MNDEVLSLERARIDELLAAWERRGLIEPGWTTCAEGELIHFDFRVPDRQLGALLDTLEADDPCIPA